jgi:hypothetical protein
MGKDFFLIIIVVIFWVGFVAGIESGKSVTKKEINVELLEKGLKYYHPESGELVWKEEK